MERKFDESAVIRSKSYDDNLEITPDVNLVSNSRNPNITISGSHCDPGRYNHAIKERSKKELETI
jgi:hypothetical protein